MSGDVHVCPWCRMLTTTVETWVRRCESCRESFFVEEGEGGE